VKSFMKRTLRIGTRGSALALTQTNWVVEKIRAKHPGVKIEIITIKTTGDKLEDVALAKIGGKGLFVKEIEEALLRGEIHAAVHSLKDMPAETPGELEIGVIPEREDPRDVLISRGNRKLEELPGGAKIGTGSLRRSIQLAKLIPHVQVVPIRGNLDTRIKKIEREGLDGIIVAAAGVRRMGWTDRVSQFISVEQIIPAIGQGALAMEMRRDDEESRELFRFLNHEDSRIEVGAERAFLRVFGGGCQLPIAAYGRRRGDGISLVGLVGNLDGSVIIRDEASGPAAECEAVGKELAERILSKGGKEIMETVYECG
jgi:hydroxymethylbilane synthase